MARKQETEKTPAAPVADGKGRYLVTEHAPGFLLGRRVSNGDQVALTPAEAWFELMSGHIIEAPSTSA